MKKNIKIISAVLALAIITAGCVKQQSMKDEIHPVFNLDLPSFIPEGHYEVYSIVLDSLFTSRNIIVNQKSTGYTNFTYYSLNFIDSIQQYPKFDSTLVYTHDSINKVNVFFDEKFVCDSNEITLISDDELEYIFDRDIGQDWDYFYEKYPDSGGTVNLTRIALNHEKTQAAFEIRMTYGGLGAHGYIVYLVKENEKWLIAEIFESGLVS